MNPPSLIEAVVVAMVLIAAILDLRSRRIPNWLTLPGVLVGISLNAALSGTPGLISALKGMGLALLIYLPLFALRAMGAGDAKLMAAIGAFLGPLDWFSVFVLAALCGAVMGMILAARRSRLRQVWRNVMLILMSLWLRQAPHSATPELDIQEPTALRTPHGVAIAIGTFLFFALRPKWFQ